MPLVEGGRRAGDFDVEAGRVAVHNGRVDRLGDDFQRLIEARRPDHARLESEEVDVERAALAGGADADG